MEGDAGRPKRTTRKGKVIADAMEDQLQEAGDLGAAAQPLAPNPLLGQGNENPELMHMEGAIPKRFGNGAMNPELGQIFAGFRDEIGIAIRDAMTATRDNPNEEARGKPRQRQRNRGYDRYSEDDTGDGYGANRNTRAQASNFHHLLGKRSG